MVTGSASRIAAVRRFNRFYTRHIGLLQNRLYHSPFSLTEVRVLYELAHREQLTASVLCRELALDPGYLSRMLRSFERLGLLARTSSPSDARQSLLALTAKGRRAFALLDARSQAEIGKMLESLSPPAQERLVEAMNAIEQVLAPRQASAPAYLLRSHQPGDIGWVVHRHGVLYSQEYGYDERFEALVAEIAAKFVQHFDAKRERCWIAERDGENVGCVFLVKKSKAVAKLRMLLVEPKARGLGIGCRLVEECINFARRVGYKKMVLWTQSELLAARGIYQAAGFRLIHSEAHQSWGRDDLISEVWELKL